MASIDQKTFAQLVAGQVAAIQARAAGLVDFAVGSVLRAIVEAGAQVALWLQGMILVLLATTRAATSTGADLDSWMADFGLARLPATTASGEVTFARFSTGIQAVVPVGATVQTADGSQNFIVTLDAAHPAYSAGLGGYIIAAGAASVTAPAAALAAGAAGNVVAGAISVMTTAIAFVDTVTNSDGFAGGADAERDAAFRLRFVNYINSLTDGTFDAVAFAVQELGPEAIGVVIENETYAGATQLGFFCVIVDDGAGSPSPAFLAMADAAIEATRPLTSTFQTYAQVILTAAVTLNIVVLDGYVQADVKADVEAAITAYINALAQQRRVNPRQKTITLDVGRLIQVSYDASPGVSKVSALQVNGGGSDITAAQRQTIRAGAVTATVI